MTIDEVMKELLNLHSEANHMYRPFGNLENMVDCDEPPKRMDNYKIKFVKNGMPYICDIESKDYCNITPNDLMPAIECFKPDYQKLLKEQSGRINQIVIAIEELKKYARINEDF